jgi:glycosyltransferase involved in cell wall biosynthesis
MKVSICVITYNHAKFITEALNSFLMQTFNDYEIVISDDCSTDENPAILQLYKTKYPDKIKLLLNKKNIGMVPNFIQALKACSGEYIAFCEGDDYWVDSSKLQRQIDFLEKNPSYVGTSGGVKFLYQESQQFQDLYNPHSGDDGHDVTLENYIEGSAAYFQTLTIRSHLIKIEELNYCFGDIVIQTMVLQHGPIRHLPYLFTIYRRHADGVTNSLFIKIKERFFGDLILLFEKLNLETQYKFDKAISRRLFDYRVCYKFSKHSLSPGKKAMLILHFFFNKAFLRHPSIKKAKTILSVAFKNSYQWALPKE